jgi:hypothetical protein
MNSEQLHHGIEKNLPVPSREELWEAIENKDLEKYSLNQIREGIKQTQNGVTLYGRCATHGYLNRLPSELHTTKNLLSSNKYNYTCLEITAYHGHLKSLPPLPYTTLKCAEAHLLNPNKPPTPTIHPTLKKEILTFLRKKIYAIETLQKSLKQTHERIL